MPSRGPGRHFPLLLVLIFSLLLASLAVFGPAVPAAPPAGRAPAPAAEPPPANHPPAPSPVPDAPSPGPPGQAPPARPSSPRGEEKQPAPPPAGDPGPALVDKPSSYYQVLGYYAEDFPGDDRSYESLAGAPVLTGVASFSYLLGADGRLTGEEPRRVADLAGERNLQRFALVHNFQNGGFDRAITTALLESTEARRVAVQEIVSLVRKGGFRGVHLDLENVDPRQREEFSAFFRELATALRAEGFLATLAVPAKNADHPEAQWSGAYDYAALGRAADLVVLMTYDQHWAGGAPGPVAGTGWVAGVVKYAVEEIPARKILLGLAAYGYDWGPGGGRTVPAREAAALAGRAGVQVRWDDASQSPTFQYRQDGMARTVWYENASSARRKLALVTRYGLAGVAIWRLGFEEAELWREVGRYLGDVATAGGSASSR